MAVTVTLSNRFKAELLKGSIDLDNDTLIVILMNTSFVFDLDTHSTLADVTASQIATGNGYTQDTTNLYPAAPVAQDNASDSALLSWDDVLWTASGGSIGPFASAIIYDDTTVDDVVIGCIDFGTTYTVSDGAVFTLKTLSISQQ